MNLTELIGLVGLAHLHLLLNYFPMIGTAIALGLLLVSFVGKEGNLMRASLVVLLVVAVLALLAYMTGNAAQEAIANRPEVSNAFVAAHEDSALLALVFMMITGVFAWIGLWQSHQKASPARWNLYAVVLLSIVSMVLMTRTALLGSDIRHEEIRSGGETIATQGTVQSIGAFILDHGWVWPMSETFHFIGLCLLFGTVLTVNLRMLGVMKSVSLDTLRGLLPWALLGLGVNVITGMVFFIATPTQYTQNVAFHWKMISLLLAGANVLYLTFDEAWTLERGDDAPLTAKIVAAAGIFFWLGVIFFGRMLPFLGNAF